MYFCTEPVGFARFFNYVDDSYLNKLLTEKASVNMSSLIIPLVSAGNVAQLTTDLILHSLADEFDYVCDLDSTYLHPFVGPLDYVSGVSASLYDKSPQKKHSTPLELYHNPKKQLYVLQQRTPIIQGYENNFCHEVLVPLVQKLSVEKVLILDSISIFDSLITLNPGHSGRFSIGTCELSSISDVTREFQQRLQLDTDSSVSLNKTLFKFTDSSIQDGISAEQLVFKLCYHLLHISAPSKLREIKYFSIFVHEGDNSQDALLVCEQLPVILPGLGKIVRYATPVSWKGVYGMRPIPSSFEDGLYI